MSYYTLHVQLTHSIVEFESPDQARDALAQLHEKSFMGRDVFIREVGDRPIAR